MDTATNAADGTGYFSSLLNLGSQYLNYRATQDAARRQADIERQQIAATSAQTASIASILTPMNIALGVGALIATVVVIKLVKS